jgi:hypothetical protein
MNKLSGHSFLLTIPCNINKIYHMKTGKIFKMLLLIVLLAAASPSVSFAANPASATPENSEARVNQLQNRLEEIRGMDTKKLSREEKRALRTEVKTIKKEMAAVSGGVYLSVGALIIIALLLILLL